MDTLKAAIGLAPAAPHDDTATEPVAGAKGPGTGLEPYDAGNSPEACEAAERKRAEEDAGGAERGTSKTEEKEKAEGGGGGGGKAKEDGAEEEKKRDHEEDAGKGADRPGAPKENPEAIPTAGGEKVGTQPVPGRETGDDAPPPQGSKEGEAAGAQANGEAKSPAAEGAKDVDGEKTSTSAGGDAPTAPATPAKADDGSSTPVKPVSSAQKAMQDAGESSPGSTGGLERRPSKMSRLVKRLKGRKSRGGEGEGEEEK